MQDTVVVPVGDRLRLAVVPVDRALTPGQHGALHPLSFSPFLFAPNPARPPPSLSLPPSLWLQWRIITGLRSEGGERRGEERREGESAASADRVVVVVENLQSVSSFRRGETCAIPPLLPRLKWSTTESKTTKERTHQPTNERTPSIFDPFVIHHGSPQLGIRHAFLHRHRRHRPLRSDLRHGR